MKVAIYVRVSTEEQALKHSIDAQLDNLMSYAKNNNYEIYDEYIDPGYTGTLTQRPRYQDLIKDALKGKFEMILVYKIDRLFRSTRQLLNLVYDLEQVGVSVCASTEPFNTSTTMGKFMLQLFASFAELERNVFLERSEMGRLERLKKGYPWGGKPPFGYNYNQEKGKLEINEAEAEIVRLIFERYCLPDSSTGKVADELNKLGYKTRFNNNWISSGIHEVLVKPCYTGEHVYNKITNKSTRVKAENEWIKVKVSAIVPEGLYKKAQKLLHERRVRPSNVRYNYLLNHKLYCGQCDSSITGISCSTNKKSVKGTENHYYYLYYRCNGASMSRRYSIKDEKKKNCKMKQFRAAYMENIVWNEIVGILTNPQVIEDALKKRVVGPTLNIDQEIEKTNRQIEQLSKEKDKVIALYRKDKISESDLYKQFDDMEKERKILLERMAELNELVEEKEQEAVAVASLFELCDQLKGQLSSLDFKKKREIVDLMIEKIVIFINGLMEIHFTIPAKSSFKSSKNSSVVIEKTLNENKVRKFRAACKDGNMVERSGSFTTDMYSVIERLAKRKKVNSAEMIRIMVSFVMDHDIIRDVERKELFCKQELKGFTQKRKAIHFTGEQAHFLDKSALLLNLSVSEIIRLCVNKYCDYLKVTV